MSEHEDALTLLRRAERLKCEILVMKDLLRRAGWYLGTDKQSSEPTEQERVDFLNEVREHRRSK